MAGTVAGRFFLFNSFMASLVIQRGHGDVGHCGPLLKIVVSAKRGKASTVVLI